MPDRAQEIADLTAKLAASEGMPGYQRRAEAIRKRIEELRNAD